DTATGQVESIPLPGPRFVIAHLTRPLDEVPLVAESNTYYRIIVEHPSIEPKAIDSALEGIALGWVIDYQLPRQEEPPGLPVGATHWEDIVSAYVAQMETQLDRSRLTALGQGLVRGVDADVVQ